jgi:hypothetical protein
MPNYVTSVDFSQYDRDRGEVMRQRIDGNEDDGIRYLLDDIHDAYMPDSPPTQEEPPEPEELETTAKVFYDMMAAAKRPLYDTTRKKLTRSAPNMVTRSAYAVRCG